MKYASWLFGIASVWAGILDLVYGEFEPAHQPIQAWSDQVPGVALLARLAAMWLIAGGLALLVRPAARLGSAALVILYAIFCLFPIPRLITAPHFLGHHPGVYIGVIVTIGQQIIVFVGAVSLWLSLIRPLDALTRFTLAVRWLFGLSTIDFGLGHLVNLQATIPSVPSWMPLGRAFWTVLTGIAFVLAGLAIIAGVLDVLAARLTSVMLLVFSVLVLTPRIFAAPHSHLTWGSDAYNLTAVAASWIVSVWLQKYRHAVIAAAAGTAEQPAST
jgi:uncharacterized membrane protein YphA (DoxX/SURF4 family)